MKRKLFSVIVAIFLFCFANTVLAGGGLEESTDSLRTAQVFGGLEIQSYGGGFNFQRDGVGDWICDSFKMTAADGKIFYLKIGGTVVVTEGDEPLDGLPVNAVGETRDFNLNLWTIGPGSGAYGYFYSNLLLPGDPIVIFLSPNYVSREVKFSGDGNELVLQTEDGGINNYNASSQSFYVWLHPAKLTEFVIYDPVTNVVYQRGVIDPLEDIPVVQANNFVTVKLPVGIEQVPDEQWVSFEYQKMDGSINGVPGKVYLWDLKKSRGYIDIDGLVGDVDVRRWVESGEMPQAAFTNNDAYLWVEEGYEKVVVIVTGTAVEEGFFIYFSR